LGLYYLAPRGWRMLVLTACSYVFYAWTNPWFVLILAWATVVDFICGNFIYGHWRLPRVGTRTGQGGSAEASSVPRHLFTPSPYIPDQGIGAAASVDGRRGPSRFQQRLFVTCSLISNLGMLAFFKYFMFAQENINHMLAAFGKEQTEMLTVLLPAGISFYTFESISYTLDIYFGRAKPASAWIFEKAVAAGRSATGFWRRLLLEVRALNAFACYITQYPHLVAGPIIRYQDLEQQIHQREHSVQRFALGIAFLSMGMAKKVLLANPMGDIADAAFAVGPLPWYDAWYGIFGYAFQLYFDFSGYSDMAIGLGLMVGFVFPRNFASPYKAHSVTDFWRRWHISLSTWLRDYLYIPLGGNRRGESRTYGNLLVVMLLGGFWHGASWNFLIWGGIHGTMLAFERLQGKDSLYRRAPVAARIGITFLVVCIAWVFFRAETLPLAWSYCCSLFGMGAASDRSHLVHSVFYAPYQVAVMLLCAAITWGGVQTWDWARRLTPLRGAISILLLILSVIMLWTQTANPFLYFQF
ncbi:MAG TPA: MBOAT family O-acyltransferase, partial [Herpetosiphonaceae bacterium]|nr:MBOAT family O-acyltransferase [Herpetosiphonaceae bacterium]